mmetsp:Transcript_5159/g.12689  ORF Transcript_5159/g.12689 Transcript_5159/m.12689 type:complete len:1024 (-) Transcript_5159:483-3554(-)|eukprot:CAMPEP_0202859578 /NCGR_PEP_ID=MMETSP1391-20130828/1628_1 /ASSEMBLY_ACC=CAM_ASM_000867 /TAXON_ID=1034604 /ORGANISM="Chlamydomonas leiostraca, Strain SAG 11-49" /LENGTH=1023 /DNA_ID=CAMNT_0049538623 /DNA_START=79 /DNA_END=3150 /DNA_ORIENTATION=+
MGNSSGTLAAVKTLSAARKADEEKVVCLVRRSVSRDLKNNNTPSVVTLKSFKNKSLFHLASARGHVNVLLELQNAVQREHGPTRSPEALAKLVNSRAKPKGETPLHLACASGHLDTARLLVWSCGADPTQPDRDGSTPLHYAARHGHGEVVSWLLELGEQVDAARPAMHSHAAAGMRYARRTIAPPSARQVEALLPILERLSTGSASSLTASSDEIHHSSESEHDVAGDAAAAGKGGSSKAAEGKERPGSSASESSAASAATASTSNCVSPASTSTSTSSAGTAGAGYAAGSGGSATPVATSAASEPTTSVAASTPASALAGAPSATATSSASAAAPAPYYISISSSLPPPAASASYQTQPAQPPFLQRLISQHCVSGSGRGPGSGVLPCRFVDVQNSSGFTALHFAVAAGHVDIVEILLSARANTSLANHVAGHGWLAPCPRRSNPLHIAARRGHVEITRTIVRSHMSAPPDVRRPDPRLLHDIEGFQPYQVAGNSGHWACAGLLLSVSRDDTHSYWTSYLSTSAVDTRPRDIPKLGVMAAKVWQDHLVAQIGQLADTQQAQQQEQQQAVGRRTSQQLSTAGSLNGTLGSAAGPVATTNASMAAAAAPLSPTAAGTHRTRRASGASTLSGGGGVNGGSVRSGHAFVSSIGSLVSKLGSSLIRRTPSTSSNRGSVGAAAAGAAASAVAAAGGPGGSGHGPMGGSGHGNPGGSVARESQTSGLYLGRDSSIGRHSIAASEGGASLIPPSIAGCSAPASDHGSGHGSMAAAEALGLFGPGLGCADSPRSCLQGASPFSGALGSSAAAAAAGAPVSSACGTHTVSSAAPGTAAQGAPAGVAWPHLGTSSTLHTTSSLNRAPSVEQQRTSPHGHSGSYLAMPASPFLGAGGMGCGGGSAAAGSSGAAGAAVQGLPSQGSLGGVMEFQRRELSCVSRASRVSSDDGCFTCELCFDRPRTLRITSCTHSMCASCSQRVVLMGAGSAAIPRCAFCQRPIKGFALLNAAPPSGTPAASAVAGAAGGVGMGM